MKATKNNNFGKGFWYTFKDGTVMWALGMNRQELNTETRKHGALVKRDPA